MALPVLNAPTHEMTLVSNGQTIKFRPFLVKEEKILLMALESNNDGEMLNSMKQIINNCVLDDIDVEELPLFDVQYIFLQLRSKSVGEVVELRFKHPDDKNLNGEECKHEQNVKINISDIKPSSLQGHSNKIQLTPDIGVTMKYPKIDIFRKMMLMDQNDSSSVEAIFDIMISSIDMIYQGDEIFYKDDHSEEEMNNFLSSLTSEQFNKLRDFFQTMPYLRHEFEYKCTKCGVEQKVMLNGIEDFFA